MTEDRPRTAADLDDRRVPSWDGLEHDLIVALEEMLPETFLIIALPDDEDGRSIYVQFAHATTTFRAEAVSGRYMPAGMDLSTRQKRLLTSLGWERPGTDGTSKNYFAEWPVPQPSSAIAALAVATLRDVYRVPDPNDLWYTYASFDDRDVETNRLPLRRRPPGHEHPSSVESPVPDGSELHLRVRAALEPWLGETPARDDDGDYAIRAGSALTYVRVVDGPPPFVAVFSPFLRSPRRDAALYEAVNDINTRIRFARVMVVPDGLVLATELPAVDLTASQIALACLEVSQLADHLDDELKGRFGGKPAFSERPELLN